MKHDVNPAKWVEDHGDYLFRYAMTRLNNNRSTAEDTVQETFLAAMKAKERYDGRSPVRYWLLGILRHKIVDHIRKASRITHVEDAEEVELLQSFSYKAFGVPGDKPEPWRVNPRKVMEQGEFWTAFQSCLGNLKETMRDAFVLKELEGVPTDEICKLIGVNPNNLWVILHRARNQLKACLETNWVQANEAG